MHRCNVLNAGARRPATRRSLAALSGALVACAWLGAAADEGGSTSQDDLSVAATFNLGLRLELGRYRYDQIEVFGRTLNQVQFSLLHAHATRRWLSDASAVDLFGERAQIKDFEAHFHFGGGVGGFGQYMRLGEAQNEEIGWLLWPLSGSVSGMSYAQFNTHLYYRRRSPGGFLEAGLSLPLYWVDEAEPSDEDEGGAEPALYGPSDAPVFVYVGGGWSTDASTLRTSTADTPAPPPSPWTDNDVAQIAVMAPAVVRLDLLRWRFEALQVGLAHGLFGLAWNLRAQFGIGVAGVGGHWRATDDGAEEIGFMTWPLLASTTDDLIISYLNTQVYYRWSGPTTFTEAGLWVSPFWAEASLGAAPFKEYYPLNSPGVSAYIGFGL